MSATIAAETRIEGVGKNILLIDIKDLARMLSRSERTLWRDHAAGRIPRPIQLGGTTRWRIDEIREWVTAGCPDRATWEATRRPIRRTA
jgi:predicted DNA-binding transcriptional regulator AlpA